MQLLHQNDHEQDFAIIGAWMTHVEVRYHFHRTGITKSRLDDSSEENWLNKRKTPCDVTTSKSRDTSFTLPSPFLEAEVLWFGMECVTTGAHNE